MGSRHQEQNREGGKAQSGQYMASWDIWQVGPGRYNNILIFSVHLFIMNGSTNILVIEKVAQISVKFYFLSVFLVLI